MFSSRTSKFEEPEEEVAHKFMQSLLMSKLYKELSTKPGVEDNGGV